MCTRHASYAFFERMRLISWRHVLFWCVWHGLRSSRTCFYIDASDSLLWLNFTRTQTIPDASEKDVTSRNQTHASNKRTGRMPCASSFMQQKSSCKSHFANMLPNKENKLQCTNVSNVMCVVFCFVFSMNKTVRPTDADKIAIFAQHPKSLGTAGIDFCLGIVLKQKDHQNKLCNNENADCMCETPAAAQVVQFARFCWLRPNHKFIEWLDILVLFFTALKQTLCRLKMK